MPSPDDRNLARYLPLSIRPRVDESKVTNDWRAQLEALWAVGGGAGRDPYERARARTKVRVRDLGDLLVAVYEAGGEAGAAVDATTSGAVCLARIQTAPRAIRAVVGGRTLIATDAGWELGTGPALSGTARELTLFLYGKAGVPAS